MWPGRPTSKEAEGRLQWLFSSNVCPYIFVEKLRNTVSRHFTWKHFKIFQVWDFESIDNADTNDEGALFEMDPMYELKVM